MKITIYELAKKAGVSIATISRAINPETRAKVAPETLRQIDELIAACGYTPNLAAKHLSKAAYKTIGVLFPHHKGMLLSEYYTQILSGIADYLLESDYRMKMVLLKPGKWDHYDFKNGEAVDGLIVTYWRTFFSNSSVFRKLNVPCAVINNVEKDVHVRYLAGDHFEGGRMAAEYLYDRGHRWFAVMTGSHGAPDAKIRLEGFKSFLASKKVKLNPKNIFDVQFEEGRAYEMTDKLLGIRPAVTAVFCMNDVQAHGVLRRLKDLGISCPGRISVMGYDDDSLSDHSVPPLTTIRVPVYELAKTAARDLIRFLDDKKSIDFYQPQIVPVSLVERASVRKL